MRNFKEDIALVKAFAFDVDGVFTDGSLSVGLDTDFIRTYYARDGFAVVTAIKRGYKVAIITGGRGESISRRFGLMGVEDIYLGCNEKLPAIADFMQKHNLSPEEVMYVGDDIPDVAPMKVVGMPVCPKDAAVEVKAISRYVSGFPGGRGCVRDVVEQVLRARDDWFDGTADVPSV